jgi:hypothetical protein
MKRFLVGTVFLIGLAAGAQAQQITGSTKLTVATSTPSAGALLTGAVVTSDASNCASSTISVAVPTGWSLVCARGFEGSPAISSSETAIFGGGGGGINTTNPHSGNHSLAGSYNGPDQTVLWQLNSGILGSFSEVYISFWEYVDSNALYPDSDFFYGGLIKPGVCGQIQDIQYDMQNFSGQNSSNSATLVLVSEGPDTQATPCMGKYQYSTSKGLSMNGGSWRQFEIHISPSTSVSDSTSCLATNNGSDCTGNGSSQFYVNGQQLISMTGVDINGTTNMSNAQVSIGGVLTDLSGCGSWATTSCSGSRPGAMPPSPFNRYIDDVIVLKR